MSAFDEANGSKFENLENKMVPVLAALMILEAVNNWRRVLQINI